MQLIVKAKFDEPFSSKLLEKTLRATPKSLRSNLRNLEFRVDPDNYLNYLSSIAARQGALGDQYLSGLIGDPTYGGAPVRSDPSVDPDTIELYHPNPIIHVDVTAIPE